MVLSKFSEQLKKLVFFSVLSFSLILYSQDTNWTASMADAIIQRYANINDLTGKGWEYSNSIVLVGFEKLFFETGDTKYLDYIKKYIDKYVNNAGTINFNADANNLDHLHPALLCVTLYKETGLAKYKTAAEKIRDEFDNQPRNDSGGFWHKEVYPNQMWADGIYMAEPFLMRYGAAFDDLEYASDEATKQVILLANHAYDSSKHLIYHGWDDTKTAIWANSETGVSPEVWSRAMGWYCMALVDILDYLPKSHNNYDRMIEILQGLAVGIKNYQDTDSSLWYQVVDKGDSAGNWIETSGSGMFIYTLKKAMRKGYIDTSYNSAVDKAWKALKTRISFDESNLPVINDFVGGMGIKPSYSEYVTQTKVSTPPSSHPHGYCAFLLAGSEMEFKNLIKFQISLDTIGLGSVIQEPGNTTVDSGTIVSFTAVPGDGYEFAGWEGDTVSGINPISFQIKKDILLIARFVKTVSGINHHFSNADFQVYPSIANDYLYIAFGKNSDKPFFLEVIDATGKIAIESKVTSVVYSPYRLNLSELLPGNYILLIKCCDSTSFQKKFLKK